MTEKASIESSIDLLVRLTDLDDPAEIEREAVRKREEALNRPLRMIGGKRHGNLVQFRAWVYNELGMTRDEATAVPGLKEQIDRLGHHLAVCQRDTGFTNWVPVPPPAARFGKWKGETVGKLRADLERIETQADGHRAAIEALKR